MVYYHIAVDRVILERSLDTRLSVYTVYSVESKHTVREGGGRGNTTLLGPGPGGNAALAGSIATVREPFGSVTGL